MFSHLAALVQRAENERDRLAKAKTERERIWRQVIVDGCEKEIIGEVKRLKKNGFSPPDGIEFYYAPISTENIDLDELAAELEGIEA